MEGKEGRLSKSTDVLSLGSRVILISRVFNNSPSNPVWGLEHSCAGTVSQKGTGGVVAVLWDNGKHNTYRCNHLSLYGGDDLKKNPNLAFIMERKTIKVD